MTTDEEARARRRAAVAACERVLSGKPESTLADFLARAGRDPQDAGVDLSQPVDTYGDGVVEELERRVAELLGMPSAVFFPTGTMAQQVALRVWAGRTGSDVVALHPLAHPEVHERAALSVVSGLRTVHPTRAPRQPTADEVRELPEPFGTLMLELPLRDAGYLLPTWEQLSDVVAAARERDAVVHFDGARLWECVPHFGRPLQEIAGLADSVYVSFYKSLGGISGAALAGPEDFTAEAKVWRHRYGGQIAHQFPSVLSAMAGLARELPRLPSYVEHAKAVAAALAEGLAEGGVVQARVNPAEPHTHEFQLWLPYPAAALNEAALRQAEETGVSVFGLSRFTEPGPPGISMTEVSAGARALAWSAADVRTAAAAFAAYVTG
ncbi:threonine aldolase family protein [Actinacidiphila yeochonensis]|uniref:threonine aldolase family protein n=1 Tax=Actinacidiphila yeochonensis TaxID=89050 RepID=UPI00055EE096|nr:beta-eliminating lyase-related protein [Actinacidiphila yeochonensis]